MLIRFRVENFLSFRDEIEFSMLPGKTRKHPEHIVSDDKRGSLSILKTSVIYGANASGKTNLIKALRFAKDLIVGGKRPKTIIAVKPFKLDAACANKPSKFEFAFKHKSQFFIYGFTLDTYQIHSEWLYEITPHTEKQIFERETSVEGETVITWGNIKFDNSKEREFLDFTAMGTRPNQLFLTESIDRDIKHFEDVFDWFKDVLIILGPDSRHAGLEINCKTNVEFQQAFQNYLQVFDTGITGIDLIEFDFDEESSIPQKIKNNIREKVLGGKNSQIVFPGGEKRYSVIRGEQDDIKALKIMTTHKAEGENSTVSFEVDEESSGTQRLFDLIPALMDLFSCERVFVIDELDRSLHPHLSYKIIEMFLSNNPKWESQLIVTTHEASILDLDLLRRDEIWFVEKDTKGASTLYSLEEFAPRYDKDIRKGYLLGRFGAIPFVKNVRNLDWVK